MESPKPVGSPLRQSRVPSGFYESRHDIELQSPTTASFLVDEKFIGPFPSPPVTPQQHSSNVALIGADRKTPARKYSREWWQSSWDIAVANRVWPRVLYIAFGITVITIWVGLTVHFATDQIRWDRGDDQPLAQMVRDAGNTGGNTGGSHSTGRASRFDYLFSLTGSLKSFDPVARNLHIEWSGLFQEKESDKPVPLSNGTYPNAFWPMDIYRDVSTVVFDASYTDENTTVPLEERDYQFRIDNSTAKHIGSIGWHEWDSIATDITFQQNAEQSDWRTQPLFSYPFDEWRGRIVFVGDFRFDEKEKSYANTTQGNYTGIDIVSFAGARLEDNSLNWRFSLNFTHDCYNNYTSIKEEITKSLGPLVNPDEVLQVDSWLRQVTVPCNLDITIVAKRPPIVQFAAIMALIVNWISTIFIFVLTAECLLMRRGFMMSGTDLLGVTFTSLFALPSVRLLLPGAPEFGCLIDLIGIIPNVLCISLCITAIAVTKLNRRRHSDHQKGE